MKIAHLDLGERPVMLAPMEDVTDPSFRLICREMGARLVYTEFVSAEALVRNISSTTRKLHIDDRERPVAIQIYGREPEAMVEAAKIVEQAGPDLLDINFGCPVKKVASKGAGAGMLRDIPIIGNGDITTPEQAVAAFDTYGVDGIMIGRGAIGSPWIFREVTAAIAGNDPQPLSVKEKFDIIRRQVRESIERIDEYRGILHIRRHLAASPLFKGLPNFRETRIAMLRAETEAELLALFDDIARRYFADLI